MDAEDGHNVVLHEFAHLLDDIHRHRPTPIDPYGATNPAEFFAVATELLFEKPRRMKVCHPALYEEL